MMKQDDAAKSTTKSILFAMHYSRLARYAEHRRHACERLEKNARRAEKHMEDYIRSSMPKYNKIAEQSGSRWPRLTEPFLRRLLSLKQTYK